MNVTLAYIDGIQIAAYYMSGLIIEQSTDVHINNTALTLKSSRMNVSDHEFGLLIFNSSRIAVESLQVDKFSWGIAPYKSNSIGISNTTIHNCTRMGVLIFEGDNVSVVNVLSQNNRHGLVSASTDHIIITNSALMKNSQNGITLIRLENSNIFLISNDCANTTMKVTRATHNTRTGLHVTHSAGTGLSMINNILKHNNDFAMKIRRGTIIMENVYASNNFEEIAIHFDVYMGNVSTEYNHGHGVYLDIFNAFMSLVSSNYNDGFGIVIHNCTQSY